MSGGLPQRADYDIAILGAGAAGLTAAIFAGEEAERRGIRLRIALLDGAKKPGAKILVSGGGRCNVTNTRVTPEDYCGGSPKIIRNVLRSFDEQQTIGWMESLGVDLKLEPTGKYFPVSNSARSVLDALMRRVDELGVQKLFGFRVSNMRQNQGMWQLTNAIDNSTISAERLIVATGGRALPKSGSDGAAYSWLNGLGHSLVTPVPALAPLILDPAGVAGSPLSFAFADLSGITLDARLEFVADNKRIAAFTGSLLFTHFGLSGPAAMNVSRHVARHRQENSKADPGHLRLGLPNFADAAAADGWLLKVAKDHPRATPLSVLSRIMPERMAVLLATAVRADRMSVLSREERLELARLLSRSPLAVKGDRGYSFAEATAGGVALDEVSWKTMESRKAPGLHLCGEVLDVDGRIGGFNFQWAWATGYLAGRGAVKALTEIGAE